MSFGEDGGDSHTGWWISNLKFVVAIISKYKMHKTKQKFNLVGTSTHCHSESLNWFFQILQIKYQIFVNNNLIQIHEYNLKIVYWLQKNVIILSIW